MNQPRKHHIQPKVLLRRFTKGRMLKRVSKFTGISDLESVKHATRKFDANTLHTVNGLDFSVEKMLGRIEDYYPDIIARLGNDPRSPEDDNWIRALVAVQMGRDPFYRAWLSEEVARIKAALWMALLDADPTVDEHEIEAEFDFYARRNIVKSHIDPHPENVAIAATSYLIQKYYESLNYLHLTIFSAPSSSFITADSPLFLYDRYTLAGRSDDEALRAGILPETEITLPLTARYAALLSARRTPALILADRTQIAIINARTVRSGKEFVYMNPSYPDEVLRMDLGAWWWREALGRTL